MLALVKYACITSEIFKIKTFDTLSFSFHNCYFSRPYFLFAQAEREGEI